MPSTNPCSSRIWYACATSEQISEPTRRLDLHRGAETEAAPAFLVLQLPVREGGEEIGTPHVGQAPEGAEAEWGSGDASVLMARKRISCRYTEAYVWV